MKTLALSLLLLAGALAPSAAAQVINLEIDYMVDSDHSHRPQQAEIDALVEMFACHGYFLNVVVDDALPHADVMRCDIPGFSDFWTCSSSNFQTFAEYKLLFFNGGAGWHYCIFGHQYDNGSGVNSSGLAEIGGNDLVVTLGSFSGEVGTPFDRASTLGHELGHNLGLRHASPGSFATSGNFAPNYASIMSYQYQLAGVASQMRCLGLVDQDHRLKDLDYSSGRMPTVVETGLEETIGLGIHEVDWDCDGIVDASPVAQGIDDDQPWCSGGGNLGVLADHDDWASIQSNADLPAVVDGTAVLDTVACITSDEAQALRDALGEGLADPTACTGSSPALVSAGCPGGLMVWVDSSAPSALPLGTGDDPYWDVASAASLAPSGSVLYLQPGTYTNGGSTLLLTKDLVLAGPGGAVIAP